MRLDELPVGPVLSRGGQGDIHEVLQPPERVLKRFHESELARAPDLAERLVAMVARRPPQWRERSGHITLAWPCDVVFDGDRLVGHLMPRLSVSSTVELHILSNPSDRRDGSGRTPTWVRHCTWRHLLQIGANLAQLTTVLHRSGYVVGDFNERNILVSADCRVTLVDCDSMQIPHPGSARPFLCEVGRAEFTAPELLDADFRSTPRRPSSDLFALAVHLFQLLMEGVHPFDGVWQGGGEKPPRHQLARQALFAYGGSPRLTPRPAALPDDFLPDDIRALFRRAFVLGVADPDERPTGAEWQAALHACAATVSTCPTTAGHVYPGHHRTCPWCGQAARNSARRRPGAAAGRPAADLPRAGPTAAAPRPGRRGGVAIAIAAALAVIAVLAAVPIRPALLPATLLAPSLPRTTIAGVPNPGAMAISPDGRRVYVVDQDCCALSVIDTSTRRVTARIPVPDGQTGLASTPDGRHLVVTDTDQGTVSIIDTATDSVAAVVPAGRAPLGVAVSPDGRRAYVTDDHTPGAVVVVDLAARAIVATIPVGRDPTAVALSPDGATAYVSNDGSNTVSVIDTAGGGVVATIPVGQYPGVGGDPGAVTVAPDGRSVYLASDAVGAVTVIDTATNTVAGTIASNGFLLAAPGRRAAYLVGEDLSVIDTRTHAVTATVPIGLLPAAGVAGPDGRRVYLADHDTDSVIVLDTDAVDR